MDKLKPLSEIIEGQSSQKPYAESQVIKKKLLDHLCYSAELSYDDLIRRKNDPCLTIRRFIIFSKLKSLGYGYHRIGMYCGNRSHATIINGVRRLNNLLSVNDHKATSLYNEFLERYIKTSTLEIFGENDYYKD